MKRDFNEWLGKFRDSIANYEYYIDFAKVHRNVDSIKVELNILNALIGSKDIENEFMQIVSKVSRNPEMYSFAACCQGERNICNRR